MTELNIRAYESKDLDQLLDAWERATRLAHPFMTDEFIAQERINTVELYLPNTDTWVAELDSTVIGFLALMGNEIGALFLQPAYHGRGIGWAMMAKARELHPVLEVEVFAENARGRAFYKRCGFSLIEEKLHAPTGQSVQRLRDQR